MRDSKGFKGPIVMACAALLASCGLAGPSSAGKPSPTPSTPASVMHVNPGVPVRAAQLLTPTTGWVLTDTRLLVTADGGRTWTDVTPPSSGSAPLLTAFFLNPSQAWAIVRTSQVNLAADLVPLVLFTSSDGGRHWASRPMPATIKFDTPGPVYLTFVDTVRGWLVVDQGSHAGFMYYTGFQTTDGGHSWASVSYPQSAPVRFANRLDGFSGGGPAARGMFVTHDGGLSWAPVVVPPIGPSSTLPIFQLPVFYDSPHGVLGGVLADPSGGTAAEAFYTTSDAGRTFSLAGTVSNPEPQKSGQVAGVVNTKVWLAAFFGAGHSGGTRLKATADGGHTWAWLPTILPGTLMDEISFAGSTGWAILDESGCRSFKTDCFTNIGLLQTTDAGAHWLQLSIT